MLPSFDRDANIGKESFVEFLLLLRISLVTTWLWLPPSGMESHSPHCGQSSGRNSKDHSIAMVFGFKKRISIAWLKILLKMVVLVLVWLQCCCISSDGAKEGSIQWNSKDHNISMDFRFQKRISVDSLKILWNTFVLVVVRLQTVFQKSDSCQWRWSAYSQTGLPNA